LGRPPIQKNFTQLCNHHPLPKDLGEYWELSRFARCRTREPRKALFWGRFENSAHGAREIQVSPRNAPKIARTVRGKDFGFRVRMTRMNRKKEKPFKMVRAGDKKRGKSNSGENQVIATNTKNSKNPEILKHGIFSTSPAGADILRPYLYVSK
jgi:hypothetical protein